MIGKFAAGVLCAAAAAVSSGAGAAEQGSILVIASSEKTMTLADGSSMDVGFFLNEFAVPAQYLADKGWRIVLATPSGKAPVMDRSSNSASFFGGSEERRASAEKFVASLPVISLSAARSGGLDRFAGVFVPGGHAPMTDLMQNADLGAILRDFHAKGKPTAMICHGPVAALAALPQAAEFRRALVSRDFQNAMKAAQGWIYKGYRMTVLSDAEEWPGEISRGAEMPFHVEQALQMAGATMEEQTIYGSHVVKDRELITGQNPASDIVLAKAFDAALTEARR
jgi:putative intracellular protease/amidase